MEATFTVKMQQNIEIPSTIRSLDLSPDDCLLACGTRSSEIFIFNNEPRHRVASARLSSPSSTHNVLFSPRGDFLATFRRSWSQSLDFARGRIVGSIRGARGEAVQCGVAL